MASNFALGKKAFGFCDLCGFRYDLKQLKPLTVKLKPVNLLCCPQCWTPDQPQLQVGMRPVVDPQALRNPRPDNSFRTSGQNILRYPSEGSRVVAWGWNPVGFDTSEAPGLRNSMTATASVGSVAVDLSGLPVRVAPTGLGASTALSGVQVEIGALISASLLASAAVGDVTTTP